MIDTFAGGVVRSGVPAQNVAFGLISGITRDPNGNLVFCDTTTHVIRRINADGTIQTIAGLGIPGYGGDGGPATSALLNYPSFPKYDSNGNLYFADANNFRIRRIDPSGTITTVAGTGIQPSLGNTMELGADGPATQAQIGMVSGLAIDPAGYVYFIDTISQLRRLTPSGKIEVFAGMTDCMCEAITADSSGNLYFSDGPHIYRISSDGIVHNFAGFGNAPNNGNGGPAIDAPPSDFIALAADAAGNLYTEEINPSIVDNFIIRRVGTNGIIEIVAGSFTATSQGDGPALQTELVPNYGSGLVADADGTVTFAEAYEIRQLTAQSTIKTLAPTNVQPAPDGTPVLQAWLVSPSSIALDHTGSLYIAESCAIRKVDSTGVLSTVAGTGKCSTMSPSGPALTTDLDGVISISVDSQNQVYFSDFGGSLYIVSTEGVINKITTIPNGFSPVIAVDSRNRVYFVSLFGAFGYVSPGSPPVIPSRVIPLFPSGLAIDGADNVYVCCAAGQIERYSADFQLVSSSPAVVAPRFPGNGLAVDASSVVWQVATIGLEEGSLPFGGGCCSYGDGGAAESAYIYASGLAFAPDGDLYVLDGNAGRVRRIHGSPPTVAPAIASGGIVNAASLSGGAIAPGELVSIFGSNFGPAGLDVATAQNNVIPAALNNVHVYFNGVAGAITARTQNQINVFVAYGVAGATSVQVVVDVDGVTSAPITVPVATSAFGLSTADASGSGQGAILNQDGTINSDSNPAARGSVVTMFGTGEGVTSPILPDGALVISTPYSTTQSPITVSFGGQTANIQYDGAAPFLPTGVFQIDATVPMDVTPGDVPIMVSIGGIQTTRTVTVAVK